MKDWTGNSNSACSALGINKNHTTKDREEHDYYATEPIAAELLTEIERLSPNIWECACGEGHLAKVFERKGYNVLATDLIDRGYGMGGIDFLQCEGQFDGDIITNPPYKYAQEFIEKALSLIPEGRKVCMFLKVQYLEGKSRKKLYETTPPKTVWVSSSRISCGKNGDFKQAMLAYAWFVWEKGYKGETTLKWFN